MLQFKFKLHLTAPIGPSIDSIKSIKFILSKFLFKEYPPFNPLILFK